MGFVHEAVTQLRGEAGARQVPGARTAIVSSGGLTPAGVLLLRTECRRPTEDGRRGGGGRGEESDAGSRRNTRPSISPAASPARWAILTLAEHGADVIKVDPPGGWPDRNTAYNRSRRSVTIDLSSTEGQTAFKRLCETAKTSWSSPSGRGRWRGGDSTTKVAPTRGD